jgi:hypothetical protein
MFTSFRKNQYFIHWWHGTDALKLDTYPPTDQWTWYIRIKLERILHKIIEPIIREHWVVDEVLTKHLYNFGIPGDKIKVFHAPLNYNQIYKKQPHAGFNILYYFPRADKNLTYKRWKYGKDIFDHTLTHTNQLHINWIVVDGSQDLSSILPIVDIYVRPSRHDGYPRLVKECELNDIPVYYPFGSGVEPSVQSMLNFIEVEFAKRICG